MLNPVPIKARSLDRYIPAVGAETIDRIEKLASKLAGARILHINATAYGGGVVELLATVVGLQRGLGLDAHWEVMFGADQFFNVTKAMHNALQGMEVAWTPHMEEIFWEQSEENAIEINTDYDFIVIHDPQPAAILPLIESAGRRNGKWIWRCHIDTSEPFAPVADYLFPIAAGYDAAVFTMAEYVPSDRDFGMIRYIPPCIDPTSLKNVPLSPETIAAILEYYGLNAERPIMCQISRFDPWKDPVGVIDAYRIAKKAIPDLQLLLAGSMASDDPEGMHYLYVTEQYADDDPDIFILTNAQQVGAIEVNAFQTAADVVLQKSLREGFGLTVSEALWKRTPVIGGDVGGIRMQIEDRVSGYLVSDPVEAGEAAIELLTDPERSKVMGEKGRESVRSQFVMTALIERWLDLFVDLAESKSPL